MRFSLERIPVGRLRFLRLLDVASIGAVLLVALAFVPAAGSHTTVRASAATLPATSISYAYDDIGRLTAVIDPNAASNGVAKYRYDAVGNIVGIDRLSSSAVSVVQLSPAKAPAGAQIIVYGTKFSATPSQDTVTFTGGATGTVTAATTTQLAVTVPAGAATGNVTVTSPNGSASSTTPFTLTPTPQAPTISGVSPAVADPGSTVVTVSGANFASTAADDALAVNRARAAVSTASSSSLTFTVPATATSGRVLVGTIDGTGSSSTDLFVAPSGVTAASVTATGRMAIGDTNRSFSFADASKNGLVVFDGTAGQSVFLQVPSNTTGALQVRVSTLSVSRSAPLRSARAATSTRSSCR